MHRWKIFLLFICLFGIPEGIIQRMLMVKNDLQTQSRYSGWHSRVTNTSLICLVLIPHQPCQKSWYSGWELLPWWRIFYPNTNLNSGQTRRFSFLTVCNRATHRDLQNLCLRWVDWPAPINTNHWLGPVCVFACVCVSVSFLIEEGFPSRSTAKALPVNPTGTV